MTYWTIYFFVAGIGVIIGLITSIHLRENSHEF